VDLSRFTIERCVARCRCRARVVVVLRARGLFARGVFHGLLRALHRRYRLIVKYKTAFYSFYLPVAAAMLQWCV
jgi:hypothetical protein